MSTEPRHIQQSATAFCFLWSVAQLLDLFSFPDWVLHPTGIAFFVAIVGVLLKPSSSGRFLASCLLHLAYLWVRSPETPNHVLFEGFVGISILVAALLNRKLRPGTAFREAVYVDAAPVLRLLLSGLYFFAVLHKLNWDFLNPTVSCAGFMLEGVSARLSLPPPNSFVQNGAIWGTLLAESSIPLLLISRRTRLIGIVVAWGFHLVLSLHPRPGIPGFSAMILALLSLYLPAGFFERLRGHAWIQRLVDVPWKETLKRSVIGAGLIGAAAAIVILTSDVDIYGQGHSAWVRLAGLLLWLPYSGALLIALWLGWDNTSPAAQRHLPGNLKAPVLVVALVFAVNCMAPYMGFQTGRALAMFSNLRTEAGHTNHLFLPRSMQIGSYQDDLVLVRGSTDPWLNFHQGSRYRHVYADVRRRIWADLEEGAQVTFERDGQTIEVDTSDPTAASVLPPLPFPLHKILLFRPIDSPGPATCMW